MVFSNALQVFHGCIESEVIQLYKAKTTADIKKKNGGRIEALSQCDVLFRWCQENIIPIYSFINLPK